MRYVITVLSALALISGVAAQRVESVGSAEEGKTTEVVKSAQGVESKTTKTAQADPKKVAKKNSKTEQNKVDPKNGDSKKPDPTKTDPTKTDPKKVAKADPKKGAKKGEKTTEAEEEDLPIPEGADPSDIAAMRGAQKMIQAEKRLAKLLKAGKIKGIDKILPFEEISSWQYEDGLKGMPKKLKKLDGKKVMMTGFMLPIDDVENIREFLLVQSLWSCCFGQPPDINGTVRVVMQGKNRTDYKFDPIKLVGTFRIKATIEDGFCVDVYQLEVNKVEVIK